MSALRPPKTRIATTVVAAAQRIPGVSTGVACAGTMLESRTFTAAAKAFLFVGTKDVRLKLGPSQPEASALAERYPHDVRIGAGGWTTIALQADPGPTANTLRKWVAESHTLITRAGRAAKPLSSRPRVRKTAAARSRS